MGDADLRLTFTKKSEGVYHVKCSVEGGASATSTFVVPMRPEELSAVVDRLNTTRAIASQRAQTIDDSAVGDTTETDGGPATRSARVEIPPEQRETAEDFGQKLFEALVDDDIRELFKQVTAAGNARIRLVMDADNTTLMGIPWEFLCDNGLFLATQTDTPIVREVRAENQPRRFVAPPTIKVLGVIASPEGPPKLDVDEEKRRVDNAVAAFSDVVDVEWLVDATYDKLEDALQRVEPHILHFVGHSEFKNGVAHIALCDDRGRVRLHSGTALANLVGKAPELRVVVLNSCEGARTGTDDPFAGLAAKLIEQGRSAVVAMQFEITDDAACVFAEKFYTALVRDRLPIDQAVATARKSVMGVNEIEFATPVLFLASSETNDVFQFQPAGASDPMTTRPLADSSVADTDTATESATTAPPAPPEASTSDLDPEARGVPTRAPTETPPAPTATAETRKRSSRMLIAAGVGSAVLIVGAIAIAGGDDPESSPTTTIRVASAGPTTVVTAALVADAAPDDPIAPTTAVPETAQRAPLTLLATLGSAVDDCATSAVWANAEELPFDDDTTSYLTEGVDICRESLDAFDSAGLQDEFFALIVRERVEQVEALVDVGPVSEGDYDELVAQGDDYWTSLADEWDRYGLDLTRAAIDKCFRSDVFASVPFDAQSEQRMRSGLADCSAASLGFRSTRIGEFPIARQIDARLGGANALFSSGAMDADQYELFVADADDARARAEAQWDAYQCVFSPAYYNQDEMGFESDGDEQEEIRLLEGGHRLCLDAYRAGAWDDPEIDQLIGDRLDLIFEATADSELTNGEFDSVVEDADEQFSQVVDSMLA